jgi:predicted Rdx family selenoprotein
MAETTITVRLLRKGARGHELLEGLGRELGRSDVVPDDNGIVKLRMDGRGGKSWDTLRDALDRAGSDWREWLHLESRPPR